MSLLVALATVSPSQEISYSQPGIASFAPIQNYRSAGVFGDFGIGDTLQKRDDAGLLTVTLKTDAPANSLVWSALKEGKDLVIGRAEVPGELISKQFHFMNWLTCRFDFTTRDGDRTIQTHVFGSRACPAVLYQTDSHLWSWQAADMPFDRCAYLDSRDRLQVVQPNGTVGTMGSPWLLLWAGPTIGSEVAPILVRLFNRPAGVRFDGNLSVDFKGPAGSVAVMPLYGIKRIPAAMAGKWREGVPDEALARARDWTAALGRYPIDAKESFSLEQGERSASIRDDFDYMEVPDEWSVPPAEWAPVPPIGVIARRAGYPVEWRTAVSETSLATFLGPYAYCQGPTSGYTIPVPSGRDQMQVPVLAHGSAQTDAYRSDLRQFVKGMTIKPDDTSDGGFDLQLKELSQAFPLLDSETRQEIRPQLSAAFDTAFQPASLTTVTDPATGCRYVMCNKIWCASQAYDREWYAGRQLDFAAQYTSLVDPAALTSNYLAVQGLYAYFRIYNDWAWMGTSSSVFGYALCGDGMNFAMEGMLGAAQMARRMGDSELWRDASCRAAKQAACTFASFAMPKWVQDIDYATWTDTSYDYDQKRGRYDSRRMAPADVVTGFGIDIYCDKTGIKVLRPGMFWHAISAVYWNNASLDRLYREHLYEPVETWLTRTMPDLFPDWTDRAAKNRFENASYGSNHAITALDARARIVGETSADLIQKTSRLEDGIAPLYLLRLKQDIYEAALPQVWLPVNSMRFRTPTWDATRKVLTLHAVGLRGEVAYVDFWWPATAKGLDEPSPGRKPISVQVNGAPAKVEETQGGYWRVTVNAAAEGKMEISIAF